MCAAITVMASVQDVLRIYKNLSININLLCYKSIGFLMNNWDNYKTIFQILLYTVYPEWTQKSHLWVVVVVFCGINICRALLRRLLRIPRYYVVFYMIGTTIEWRKQATPLAIHHNIIASHV